MADCEQSAAQLKVPCLASGFFEATAPLATSRPQAPSRPLAFEPNGTQALDLEEQALRRAAFRMRNTPGAFDLHSQFRFGDSGTSPPTRGDRSLGI